MAKKQDLDLQMSGAKVKLGKSDIVIRGAGYLLITIMHWHVLSRSFS